MNFLQFICVFGAVFSCFVQSAVLPDGNRSNDVQKPKKFPAAACTPEFRTFKLPNDDATIKLHPSCVRINRCGGCCATDLLECLPTNETPVNVSVTLSRMMSGNIPKLEGTRVVTVYKHEACACQCKIKKENCTADQYYDEDNCQCICRNESEKGECSEKGLSWLPKTCACGTLES